MDIKRQNYFKYFNQLASGRLYFYIFLNFSVGLLDGIGLAMFIPLIYLVTNTTGGDSLGKLQIILDVFNDLNIPLNLFSILFFMVLIFTMKGVMSYFRSIYFVRTQQIAARKIRFKLVHGLRDLSYEGFTIIDSGTVQNNMTTETARFMNAVSLYMSSIQNICMLLVYVVLAFLSNWQFAILVAIGGLLTNFIYKYLNKVTKENAKKISSIGRSFHAFLLQSLHNFKYLKATNYSQIYNEKLKKEIIYKEDIQYRLGKIYALSENLREPLIILVIATVIFFQVQVLEGDMGSMMAALLLFYRSLTHMANFQGFWNKFLADIQGMHSVEEMLGNFRDYSDKTDGMTLEKFGDIDIKNLKFQYGEHIVLEDINLVIKDKTSIALVGESGAGKTTLANIICGLILPQQGYVKINGASATDLDMSSYRNKIGYVTQEPVIFDDTLYNNVTFWDERNEENLNKFWQAIEMSSLSEFVSKYSDKENIPLGNNGILISGGQKQRISIARELYKNINLMIMDEATSALDSGTEKFIKDKIDDMHGKFTLVVIAHRLSTIKNVDIIYLMENGKIIDQGSYEELYASSNKFKSMVELQNVSSI